MRDRQKYVILTIGYICYALWDLRFLGLLFFISVFTWFMGRRLYETNSRIYLYTGIAGQSFTLVFLKLFSLICDTFSYRGGENSIIIPIGLSFYTLQAISYLADIELKKLDRTYSLIDILIYIGFFPTLLSGPIMKARDFLPQLDNPKKITKNQLEYGIQRIVIGLFEKFVIADRLGVAVDRVYSIPMEYSGASLIWNSFTYSLQLFFDFAAYSHIAIGVAFILGFKVQENFNLPYLSEDLSEFWGRWHISLSSWFKEYVYIPMGGSKKGLSRTCMNLMIVMLLSGIWHGSSMTFVLWGGIHGSGLVCHHLLRKTRIYNSQRLHTLKIILTFLFVNALWIPFRVGDLEKTILIFRRMFLFEKGISYYYVYTAIFLITLICVQVYAFYKTDRNTPVRPVRLDSFSGKFAFSFIVLATFIFAYIGDSAFIYATF